LASAIPFSLSDGTKEGESDRRKVFAPSSSKDQFATGKDQHGNAPNHLKKTYDSLTNSFSHDDDVKTYDLRWTPRGAGVSGAARDPKVFMADGAHHGNAAIMPYEFLHPDSSRVICRACAPGMITGAAWLSCQYLISVAAKPCVVVKRHIAQAVKVMPAEVANGRRLPITK
jgi:hypothetical protein